MNGWSPDSLKLGTVSALSGIQANTVISREFNIPAKAALSGLVVKVEVSDVAQTGTLTLKLQTAIGDDWQDSKTATFTADGIVYIKPLAAAAGDQAFFPLLAKGRVVLSMTDAADEATIVSVDVLR